jgi:hypothetical protein
MATYPSKEALPDSIMAQIMGIDVVLDPNLLPNMMKFGDKTYVISGDLLVAIDDAVLDPMKPWARDGSPVWADSSQAIYFGEPPTPVEPKDPSISDGLA